DLGGSGPTVRRRRRREPDQHPMVLGEREVLPRPRSPNRPADEELRLLSHFLRIRVLFRWASSSIGEGFTNRSLRCSLGHRFFPYPTADRGSRLGPGPSDPLQPDKRRKGIHLTVSTPRGHGP